MKTEVVTLIQQLGFTEYEAKAYLTLLAEAAPLSGYAIARESGVPRSKIYEVLENLVERGAILASYGDPTQYAPLDPGELIAQRRQQQTALLDQAEAALARFQQQSAHRDLIWDIRGRDEILSRSREVIGRAEHSILMQLWREDTVDFYDALEAAAARGVVITIVGFGLIDYPFATIYDHDTVDVVTRDVGGRWVVLSADMREVVTGIVSLGEDSRAAWTMHPGLVVPITEEIKHDLYLLEIMKTHGPALERVYGPGLVALREKFGKPATYASLTALVE